MLKKYVVEMIGAVILKLRVDSIIYPSIIWILNPLSEFGVIIAQDA